MDAGMEQQMDAATGCVVRESATWTDMDNTSWDDSSTDDRGMDAHPFWFTLFGFIAAAGEQLNPLAFGVARCNTVILNLFVTITQNCLLS